MRNGENRSRRVPPDSGKGPNGIGLARKITAMFIYNHMRGMMHLPRPAVIAESLPEPQYFLFIGRGKSGHRGKPREKPLVIGNYRRDLRLLEHDLADPD